MTSVDAAVTHPQGATPIANGGGPFTGGWRWLNRWARVTSSGRYFPLIDGLRFVAIALVFFYHLNDYTVRKLALASTPAVREDSLFRVLNVGNLGVQVFFAISGMILGMPFLERILQRKPLKLRPYFWRRVTRLEPPYLINLAIAFGLLCIVQGQSAESLTPHLLASMAYLHNVIYGTMSEVNGVAWSLEIEVQFYLLAPLLAWAIYRQSRWTRRGLLLASMIGWCLVKEANPDWLSQRARLSILWHGDHFFGGLLLADLFLVDWKCAPRLSWLGDIGAALLWSVVLWWLPAYGHMEWLSITVLFSLAATFHGRATHWLLTRPPVVVIGGMCYSLYLYHFYVISLFGRWTLPWLTGLPYRQIMLLQSLILIPATVLAGAILFRLFEKPFMVWRPFASTVPMPPVQSEVLPAESVLAAAGAGAPQRAAAHQA